MESQSCSIREAAKLIGTLVSCSPDVEHVPLFYKQLEHPIIKRFVKVDFQSRPPLPRYQSIWDVSKVLDLLKTWSPANTLNLKYTLFQNGRHFSILLFPCKSALMTTLSNVKFKIIFNLEQGNKGQFAWKQNNTEMAVILE